MTTVYIALGSNQENPALHLQRAVDDMDSLPTMTVSGFSKLYRSVPLRGEAVPVDQPDYFNAAVSVETDLSPDDLLTALQTIENSHGRVRSVRWGPRTLDLDLLLYGDDIIETERLTVPHYQMHVRNFVLYPLLDLSTTLHLPDGRSISGLAEAAGKEGLEVVADCYPWF